MAENLLDILTKVDRPTFTIDGKPHEMRHPNELSMEEFHLLMKQGSLLIKFGEEFGEDPGAAFGKIKDGMNGIVDLIAPDLPPKPRAKLNPFHVQQLLEAFIGLSRIEPKPDAQPPSKKSSQDSPDSTAAAPKTG